MSFYKSTMISFRTAGYIEPTAPAATAARYEQVMANAKHRFILSRRGHLAPASALAIARRKGAVGTVEVTHSTADLSGKGWGGVDRVYLVTDDGATERALTKIERDYSDADDVNSILDEIG